MLSKIVYKIRPAFVADILKFVFRLRRLRIDSEYGSFMADPASNFGRSLLDSGIYEPELTSLIKSTLKEGGKFLDLGANEGWFTVIASSVVGKKGIVYSIEPQSRLASVFTENLMLNQCTNVLYTTNLISAADGFEDLHVAPSTNSGSSGRFNTLRYNVPKELHISNTLESYFNLIGSPTIDVAKIDIEGGEWDLISSSREFLSRGHLKQIFLEVHPYVFEKIGVDIYNLESILLECGFFVEKHGNSWRCIFKNGVTTN